MGRRRLPPNVAALRGVPRPSTRDIPALPAIPKPPAGMRGGALKVWKRTGPELFKLGRLALVDAPTLALYCQWCEQATILQKELADTGYMIAGQKGNQVTAPVWRQYTTATNMVVKLGRELGCTPDARLRASVVPLEEDDMGLDELERILS